MKASFDRQDEPASIIFSNYTSNSGHVPKVCKHVDQEIGSYTNPTMSEDVHDDIIVITKCCNSSDLLSRLRDGLNLNNTRSVIAEMLGTFILMFCVCGIFANTQHRGEKGAVGLVEYAATAGLTVIVVIFCVGPISGAHVNPSVTLALATFGHFPWSKVPCYISAQIMGSVFATYTGKFVYGLKPQVVTNQPLQGCYSAFWVELIATSIIMFLAASLYCETQSVGPALSGVVVGMAIGLAVLITAPVSGGSMNPARSLGPAIVSWDFSNIWIYVAAPTIGALLGLVLFRFLRLSHNNRPSS